MKLPGLTLTPLLAGFTVLRPQAWPGGEGKILLTFDDGPNPQTSSRLLDVLRANGVHATFCYIGCNIERAPDIVRIAKRDGHEIANHTFRHSAPDLLSKAKFQGGLEATDKAIAAAIGQPGFRTRLVRPPFGIVTPAVSLAAREAHKQTAYLTSYVKDPAAGRRDAPRICEQIKREIIGHHGGAIVLHEMRFTSPSAENGPDKSWLPDAVAELIGWAKARGFEFVLYPDSTQDFK